MTKGVSEFLDQLPENELPGKPPASFDTQIQSRLSGSAAKGIEGRLRKLGLKVIVAPLESYIEGKGDQLHLKAGEERRKTGHRKWRRQINMGPEWPVEINSMT
jgi:hypothetical protein